MYVYSVKVHETGRGVGDSAHTLAAVQHVCQWKQTPSPKRENKNPKTYIVFTSESIASSHQGQGRPPWEGAEGYRSGSHAKSVLTKTAVLGEDCPLVRME